MSPNDAESFNQAVAMAQAGRKAEAHASLVGLVRANPADSNVLLWLAFTSSDLKLAREALNRVDQLDPANPSLAGAKSWLAQQEAAQVRVAPPSAPPFQSTPAQTFNPVSTPAQNYGGVYQGSQQFAQPASYASPSQPSYNSYAQPQAYNTASVPIPTPRADIYDDQPRKTNSTLLIGAVAAAAVVVIAVVVVVFFVMGGSNSSSPIIPDSIASQGLPVYSGADRIQLSQEDRNSLFAGFNQGTTSNTLKNPNIEVYTIKQTDKNNTISFYDKELKSKGWLAVPIKSSAIPAGTNISLYLNGVKGFGVAIGSVSAISGEPSSASSRVKPDELLLMVFTVEIKQ